MLLVSAGSVSAQTSTPTGGVSTGVPPSASPPLPPGVGTTVSFSFLSAQAGFADVLGTWVSGSGFESVSGDLAVIGGYFMAGVTNVTIHYSASEPGTLDFALGDGVGGFNYESSGLYSACPGVCDMFFSPDVIDSHIIELGLAGQDGVFNLTGITVTFGGESESYSVGEDGCPILSPEQLAKLDPSYALACSHCFTTPTPVRVNAISSAVVTVFPTVDLTDQAATYQIPVQVSGTPMTPTPGGVPGGGGGFPTATIAPTSTPSGSGCLENGDGNGAGDWEVNPVNSSAGVSTTGHYDSGEDAWLGDYNAPADGKLLRIRLLWSGGDISRIRVLTSYDSTLSTATTYLVCGIWTNSLSTNVSGTQRANVSINTSPQSDEGYFCDYNPGVITPLSGVTSIDVIQSAFTNAGDGHTKILAVEVCGVIPFTPTPGPSITPSVTGVPWLTLPPSPTAVECSVAVFRDDNVIAEFPDVLTTIDYQCYTLVPEIIIGIPDHNLTVDGVNLCVTWFQMPLISLLGITFTLDIVLVGVAMWLAKMLIGF